MQISSWLQSEWLIHAQERDYFVFLKSSPRKAIFYKRNDEFEHHLLINQLRQRLLPITKAYRVEFITNSTFGRFSHAQTDANVNFADNANYTFDDKKDIYFPIRVRTST